MANYCIPKELISKVADAMKKAGGKKLTEMKFNDLYDFFSEHIADERLAVEVAKSFREAVISKRKSGLKKWMEKNFTGKEIKTYEKSFEKIELEKEYKALKDTLTPEQIKERDYTRAEKEKTVKSNIEKLTEKLDALRSGTYERKVTPKRDIPAEEADLREQIKVELKKLDKADGTAERRIITTRVNQLREKLDALKAGTFEKKRQNKRIPSVEEQKLKNEIEKELEKLNETTIGVTEETAIEKAMGLGITAEEVADLNALHKIAKERQDALKNDPTNEAKRLEYGKALVDMYEYVENRSPSENPFQLKSIRDVLFASKSLASTMDMSAPLRQGRASMHKGAFYRGILPMFRYFGSENHYKLLKADVLTRPNYQMARKAGLRISLLEKRITQREDTFMSNLSKKIPLTDRSERAYVGFLSELRMNLFDEFVKSAKERGEDVKFGSQNLRDIAGTVNTLTGSGNIGVDDNQARLVPALNTLLFSPRKISSDINLWTALANPFRGKMKTTADKERFKGALGKIVSAATIVALFDVLTDDFSNLDPRSSDFMKLKFGDGTRFDLLAGGGGLMVLLGRLIAGEEVSSNTGKAYKLGQPVGYGNSIPNRLELTGNFVRNKLAPLFAFTANMATGENAIGTKFGQGEFANAMFGKLGKNKEIEAYDEYLARASVEFGASYVPLGIANIANSLMQDGDISTMQMLGFIYEFFGGGSQTY